MSLTVVLVNLFLFAKEKTVVCVGNCQLLLSTHLFRVNFILSLDFQKILAQKIF